MKREKSWLSRFSLAARWYLPPAEAGEVIADYTEMLGQDTRKNEELDRDLGRPRQAAALLSQEKDYRRWLIAFCVMAAAALLPGLYSLPVIWYFSDSLWRGPIGLALFFAGIAAALIWFRPKGEGREPLPGGTVSLLAVELIFAALAWAFGLTMLFRTEVLAELFQTQPALASAIRLGVWWAPLPMAALALYGLVKARFANRRWRTVYLLGLTAAVLWVLVTLAMTSTSLEGGNTDWWRERNVQGWLMVTLAGLAGTGVGLC